MFGHVGRAIRAEVCGAGRCEGLYFSEHLSAESVRAACERLQHEFRERIFSPAITVWVFLAQTLSTDHSCREAVAKLNFWRPSIWAWKRRGKGVEKGTQLFFSKGCLKKSKKELRPL